MTYSPLHFKIYFSQLILKDVDSLCVSDKKQQGKLQAGNGQRCISASWY
jgi:hypothetical protein